MVAPVRGLADVGKVPGNVKLVQWTVAYVAGAGALLQGIDIVAQQIGWPESVQSGVTLALVPGFFRPVFRC